jgi:hypothetical protein
MPPGPCFLRHVRLGSTENRAPKSRATCECGRSNQIHNHDFGRDFFALARQRGKCCSSFKVMMATESGAGCMSIG